MPWPRCLAVLAVTVALLGAPGGVCTCRADAMRTSPDGHDCCVPRTGVRAADPACCAADGAPASFATTGDTRALVGLVVVPVFLAVPTVVYRPTTGLGVPLAAPSPPPPVLRI